MSAPLVSVVIPTFNYGHLLPRALASVMAQTYPHREIIVVDNGSTDDTPAVLAGWGDQVRVVRTARTGVSAARNAGLAVARGEYLAPLDADDEWRPTKLARQLELVASEPGLAVVGCANLVVDGAGTVKRVRYFPNPPDDRVARLRGLLTREAWVGSSNSGVLLHRRVIDAVGGYDPDLFAAEDWDLWLRVGDRFAIRNVHEVLAVIWFHGTGVFRDAPRVGAAQRQVLALAEQRWPEVFDPATRRRVQIMIERDWAAEAGKPGQWGQAAGHLLAALRADPRQPAVWGELGRVVLRGLGDRVRGRR
ncbi:MAG: glycosyltransferase [Kofleriaceae bacterium]|nr:glycosyltransferase [Kofleriaceae bacterium]MBP6837487.1 glycosyltransferase [Kofleriaceae bacterium]MBP9206851.1 glycosyltransferase [Kofleriaceae bacterium]